VTLDAYVSMPSSCGRASRSPSSLSPQPKHDGS
jgi:hypothetical protein